MRAGVLLALLLVLAVSADAQQRVRVTGVFSNMQYVAEAGDVIGTEVLIVAVEGGYYAVVQIAEGSPSIPVVVPVTVNGSDVAFSVSRPFDGRFTGRVTREALVGHFGSERITLKRGKSYWQ